MAVSNRVKPHSDTAVLNQFPECFLSRRQIRPRELAVLLSGKQEHGFCGIDHRQLLFNSGRGSVRIAVNVAGKYQLHTVDRLHCPFDVTFSERLPVAVERSSPPVPVAGRRHHGHVDLVEIFSGRSKVLVRSGPGERALHDQRVRLQLIHKGDRLRHALRTGRLQEIAEPPTLVPNLIRRQRRDVGIRNDGERRKQLFVSPQTA